jgi:hypothetical protein
MQGVAHHLGPRFVTGFGALEGEHRCIADMSTPSRRRGPADTDGSHRGRLASGQQMCQHHDRGESEPENPST